MNRYIPILAGALALAGCSLTPGERAAVRDSVAAVAVEIIAEANEAGLNPIEISEGKMEIIRIACGAADKLAPVLDAYIVAHQDDPEFEPLDLRGYVAAACAIAEAIGEPADDPVA